MPSTELTAKARIIATAAAQQGKRLSAVKARAGVSPSMVSLYLAGKRKSARLDQWFATALCIDQTLLEES